jgi:hypothetical protein
MREMSEDLFRAVCQHVKEECERRGIDGVFAMGQITSPMTRAFYEFIRRDTPLDHATNGRFYNLAAIALSKMSVVIAWGHPSGGESKYEGETSYRGGIPSEDGRFAYAFSGATEDEDVQVAQSAYEFHKSLQ